MVELIGGGPIAGKSQHEKIGKVSTRAARNGGTSGRTDRGKGDLRCHLRRSPEDLFHQC